MPCGDRTCPDLNEYKRVHRVLPGERSLERLKEDRKEKNEN